MEKECPNCGKEMNVDKYINETTIITSCKFCHRIFKITYDEKKVPNNINDFNWGAFSLSSNPQLNFSTSFLRVHILSLLNLQIIRTEIPTSAYNIPLPHNAT